MLASIAMERVAFRAMRGASVTSLLITSFAVSEIIKVLFQNGISARPVPIVLPAWMSGSLELRLPHHLRHVGDLDLGGGHLPDCADAHPHPHDPGGRHARRGGGFSCCTHRRHQGQSCGGSRLRDLRGAGGCCRRALGGAARFGRSADGAAPVLKAFIATVLGGSASLSGAVLGGFVVGIVEVFLQGYLPESVAPYREAISLSIIIGLLVLRPDGLWPAPNVNRS